MTEFIASPRSYMALTNNDRTILMAPQKFRNPMVFLFVHHIIMSSWEMQFNNKSTLELYKIFCDFTNIYANKLLAVDWQIRWLRGIMLTRVFMNLATYNFCQICQLLTICDLWHCGHLATLYLWALYTFYCVIRQWILRNLRNNWPEFSIKILYRLTSRLTGIDFFSIKLVGCHPTTQSLWRQLLCMRISRVLLHVTRVTRIPVTHQGPRDTCHKLCHKTCQSIVYFGISAILRNGKRRYGSYLNTYLKLYLAKS